MSATSGTQASTNKGETTTSSSKSSKSGYDHLDINKLYKGKSTEPVAKTVTQKHGMQALGKALPARRGGSTVVKAEPTTAGSTNNSNNNNDVVNSSLSSASQPPSSQQQKPPHTLGQQPPHPQQYPHHIHHQQPPPGWQQQQQNSSQSFPPPGAPQRPPGTASPHHPHHHHHPLHNSSSNAPNAAKTGGGGPPGSMHDKNWSGGPPPDMLNNSSRGPAGGPPAKDNRNFPPPSMAAQESMQRFAQEFPSLDSGGADTGKGGSAANASMSKNNQDNQYGPGPILRPQTEGSWTQGGGRGMPRPPGPPPPSSSAGASSSTRDFGPGAERPNMGGPTPPPMSLGPGGHPPPPLGAFPMQFPPRPPFMHPNAGPGGPPGGPGPGFYHPGPGGMPNPRFGMPIPPGAPPPPSSHPQDGGPPGEGGPPPRRAGGRGPPPGQPMRPTSHFTSKPIIKAEELERMDELGQQDGGWATVQDDIDYNKKISFSDDEGQGGGGGDKENSRSGGSSGRRQQDDRSDRMTPRERESRGERDFRDDDIRDSRQSRPMKILERPQMMNDPRDQRDSIMRGDRDREPRGDPRDRYSDPSEREPPSSGGRFQNDYSDSNEQDDWKRKSAPGFEPRSSDRDGGRGPPPLSQQNRGGRMNRGPPPREEEEPSWRSGSNNRSGNFEDDPRGSMKKGPQGGRDLGIDRSGPLSGRSDRGDRERERGGPPSSERSSGGMNQSETASRRGPSDRGTADGPAGGPQSGRGGGGAGDFGPASGPFQSNLPPRLQRYHPPMFTQQQERNNQRKTPSPVPSGNATNKDRDFRDRSDRDWDRNDRSDRDRGEPQRPTYKILERNRGDSESSKDSSSHRDLNRGSRFASSSSNNTNECDTVPVRLHRDNKDSTKRLSSDSGRLLLDDDSKISPKQREDLDSMDSSYDSLRAGSNNKQDMLEGGSSNNKSSSFSRSSRPQGSSFTSSWADEVADDQDYSSSDMDGQGSSRKGSLIRDLKRGDHQIHPEERRPPPREMPRRVIIQQTKVENMKSDIQVASKPEPPPPEPKQPIEPVKVEKSVSESKPKSFPAWGDRDSLREKSKPSGGDQGTQDGSSSKDGSISKEGSERDSHSSDKETGSKGSVHEEGRKSDHGKNESENDKSHQHHQGSREKLDSGRDRDRHYDNRYGGGRYDKGGSRDMRGDRDRDRDRDNRQKPRRMDSYEQKQQQSRDNRTPDRDTREYGNSGGRNSQEKERGGDPKGGIEKTKSSDRLDKGDQSNKEKSGGEKDEFRDERRNDRDDYDRGHRGSGRGKERGGYGVYQPRGGSHSDRDRGGWGRDDGRDKGRGGEGRNRGNRGGQSGRDFYDKPSTNRGRMEEDRRGGDKEESHHQHQEAKERNKDKDTASDMSNKGSVEDLGRDKGKGASGFKEKGNEQQQDKGKKSPGTQRRNNNNTRGGARLQGYGPPSDKTPFSSGQSGHKDEQDSGSNKRDGTVDGGAREQQQNQQSSKPAPVPLMALGDISPPNLQNKGGRGGQGGRDLGDRGGSGRGARGMSQRMQRDDYSSGGSGFRGSQQRDSDRNSSKGGGGGRSGRGGGSGDAKPLMSINSNEVEGNEWESGESVDSGEDDSKRSTGGGPQSRKDGSGSTNQDTSNDASKKKNSSSTNKTNQQQQSSDSSSNSKSATSSSSKDRRIKNPPYDPRPNSNKNQSSGGGSGSNTWDSKSMSVKDNVGSQQQQQQQPVGTHSNSSTPALQETKDESRKSSSSPATNLAVGSGSAGAVGDSSGPLKTLIFENTNFKSINSSSNQPPSSGKAVGGGKGAIGDGSSKKDGGGGSSGLGELGGFTFGKVEDNGSDIGFGSFNESSSSGPSSIPPTSVSTSSGSSSVPKPIGQPPRGYSSHQPSPISPQAADLNEKVQSVKRIWEPMPVSTMPSVQEQSAGGTGDHQDNSFHGGFGSDTFKSGDSTGRDQFGPSSGYAPGTSPALSAISKPESSSSPTTSSSLRMSKQAQQQQQVETGGQVGGSGGGQISSSPFGGYTMQPQGSSAFSGMPAVPSPPSVMAYGTSQTLHAAATTGPHSGIYQAFPDAHQVMNAAAATAGRGGYGQFPTHPTAAGSGQYGLFLGGVSPMDYQSMTSYQHQQTTQGQQGAGGTSRISPGPMTTSGGGNSGVIISSASSLMNAMKQQPGQQGAQNHPSMNPMSHTPQQGYSQMSHHAAAAIGTHPPHSHPQAPPPHHLGPVGPAKPPGGYSQGGGLGTPSQTPVFIPFHDPNQHQQSVINLGGQGFLSSALNRGHPAGGPPPPQTPPVQALQSASSYYSASSGNQSGVFPGQASNQAASLQQLHVAVAPNPQIQGYHSAAAASQMGLQYQPQINLQGYNQQAAASTVSALNLNSQIIRNAGPPQSHSAYMKQQPSIELMGGAGLKSSHEQTLINQNTWNSYSLNQFHVAAAQQQQQQQQQQAGKAPGSNPNDARGGNPVGGGNAIGGQRKGNNIGGGGGGPPPGAIKYMSQGPGAYSGQVQQQ